MKIGSLFLQKNPHSLLSGFLKTPSCKKNIIEIACATVTGFAAFYEQLHIKTTIMGRSKSTFENYARHLAHAAIYLDCIPTQAEHSEVEKYLFHLYQNAANASLSYFKFTVYGLRFAYKMEGQAHRNHQLPIIKAEKKLPIVLSRNETKRLLASAGNLKHKVLIGLLYGCGLRSAEAREVQLSDIDFDRKMLHVRQGKGKKDRYVPMSPLLLGWIEQYLMVYQPQKLLLNGGQNRMNPTEKKYSPKGFSWVILEAVRKAKIKKPVSAHSLRHTFATHLLEDGLDIVSIKDLLGHARIETTLVYLHVAHYERKKAYSPLDVLYQEKINKPENLCGLLNHMLHCECCHSSGLIKGLQLPEMV